ncbi:DUF2989 domain-containing protein [Agarivorans sp.]|uniref:DUF2989 domain-containing protein n=1 Tax=Agarivorans sp. TaxID=1872412 RepID=UPI003CFCBFF3
MSSLFASHRYLVLLLPLALAGCDSALNFLGFGNRTVKSICKSNPELCEDLNQDGWCRSERADVIIARFDELNHASDENKYHLIKNYRAYNQCIELAASIEPKYDKSRKTQRVVGMLTSLEELARLEAETRESNNPYLAMYHWTQHRDQDAKERFLALEGTGKLDSPELLWTLAIYYSGNNPQKTIDILQSSFKYFSQEQQIPAKYPEAITSQYMALRNFRQAYIWAQVSALFDDHSTQDYSSLKHLLQLNEDQLEDLQEEAKVIFKQIKERQYQL